MFKPNQETQDKVLVMLFMLQKPEPNISEDLVSFQQQFYRIHCQILLGNVEL